MEGNMKSSTNVEFDEEEKGSENTVAIRCELSDGDILHLSKSAVKRCPLIEDFLADWDGEEELSLCMDKYSIMSALGAQGNVDALRASDMLMMSSDHMETICQKIIWCLAKEAQAKGLKHCEAQGYGKPRPKDTILQARMWKEGELAIVYKSGEMHLADDQPSSRCIYRSPCGEEVKRAFWLHPQYMALLLKGRSEKLHIVDLQKEEVVHKISIHRSKGSLIVNEEHTALYLLTKKGKCLRLCHEDGTWSRSVVASFLSWNVPTIHLVWGDHALLHWPSGMLSFYIFGVGSLQGMDEQYAGDGAQYLVMNDTTVLIRHGVGVVTQFSCAGGRQWSTDPYTLSNVVCMCKVSDDIVACGKANGCLYFYNVTTSDPDVDCFLVFPESSLHSIRALSFSPPSLLCLSKDNDLCVIQPDFRVSLMTRYTLKPCMEIIDVVHVEDGLATLSFSAGHVMTVSIRRSRQRVLEEYLCNVLKQKDEGYEKECFEKKDDEQEEETGVVPPHSGILLEQVAALEPRPLSFLLLTLRKYGMIRRTWKVDTE